MGTGQGREPSVDLDVADLGRLCRAVPDAAMGHLDRRWLAPVAKRAADRSSNAPLIMGDAIHLRSLSRRLIRQEQRHGYREREDHCHPAYSGKLRPIRARKFPYATSRRSSMNPRSAKEPTWARRQPKRWWLH